MKDKQRFCSDDGAVLLGRRMGHRCGSDGCAEQFGQLFQFELQEKSKGEGFTGLPAQVNSSFLAVIFP